MRLTALAVSGVLLSIAQPAAADPIGSAVVIEKDVKATLSGQTRVLAEGARVFEDELISTASASVAQLTLVDLTNLSVGPSSQLKLDKFIYNSTARGGVISLNAARGAFRFVSVRSGSKEYEVRTSNAVIGVRGTEFDVRVAAGQTQVVLHKGLVNLCRNVGGARGWTCVDLKPGQTATVTRTRVALPPRSRPRPGASRRRSRRLGFRRLRSVSPPPGSRRPRRQLQPHRRLL